MVISLGTNGVPLRYESICPTDHAIDNRSVSLTGYDRPCLINARDKTRSASVSRRTLARTAPPGQCETDL